MTRPLSSRSRALGVVGALLGTFAAMVLLATGHGLGGTWYLVGFVVAGFSAGFSASLAFADRFGNQSSFGWSVFCGVLGIGWAWVAAPFLLNVLGLRDALEMPKLWPLFGSPR